MTHTESRVLIAGATGVLGGVVVRKLVAAGIPVRAVGRNTQKLAALAAIGAETVNADLRDRDAMVRACANVGQVYSTVNNVMGHGASSPMGNDLEAHDSLCEAALAAGVQRFAYLSARGMELDSAVDFFRTKRQIEERVRRSGITYVIIQPTVFMDIWAVMLMESVRKNGTALLFGSGTMPTNFISIEDVAEFSVRVLAQRDLNNESIEIGGPSNVSFAHFLTLLEQHYSVHAKRKHIPTPVLWCGGVLLKPFSEKGARLMRMGYFTATMDGTFAEWGVAARRFAVSPTTIEAFVEALPV